MAGERNLYTILLENLGLSLLGVRKRNIDFLAEPYKAGVVHHVVQEIGDTNEI